MKTVRVCVLVAVAAACWAGTVHAQFNGHNLLGDFGVRSGSQPDPGVYASALYYRYNADKLRDSNGDLVAVSPGEPGELTVNAVAPFVWWVTDLKILGANYGAMVVAPFSDAALEVPVLGLERSRGLALRDLYVMPINLGWHTARADFMAGAGFFAPTGKYELGGTDNAGLGMWSFEFHGGATVYFDRGRSWHLATTAWYETHTDKKDTDIRVGDVLSLEGGVGKSFLEGALSVGAAYYAQWKVSEDDLGLAVEPPGLLPIGKHAVYGAGPEVTLPIPIKGKLVALVTSRFLWEFGAKTKTEGNTLFVSATFPIPPIPINQ